MSEKWFMRLWVDQQDDSNEFDEPLPKVVSLRAEIHALSSDENQKGSAPVLKWAATAQPGEWYMEADGGVWFCLNPSILIDHPGCGLDPHIVDTTDPADRVVLDETRHHSVFPEGVGRVRRHHGLYVSGVYNAVVRPLNPARDHNLPLADLVAGADLSEAQRRAQMQLLADAQIRKRIFGDEESGQQKKGPDRD